MGYRESIDVNIFVRGILMGGIYVRRVYQRSAGDNLTHRTDPDYNNRIAESEIDGK